MAKKKAPQVRTQREVTQRTRKKEMKRIDKNVNENKIEREKNK